MSVITTSRYRLVPLLALIMLVAAACGGQQQAEEATQPAATATTEVVPTEEEPEPTPEPAETTLSDVCPNPTVIQLNWLPQAERGGLIGLVDPEQGTIDADQATYSGPAIADPDLTIELRAGGPAAGFQDAVSLIHQNPEILLGESNMDRMIENSGALPTVGVVAPLEKHPQILMWDPDVYNFETIEDIRDSEAVVLLSSNIAFDDVLVDKGLLNREQIDLSYDFSPSRFIAEGNIVQQGFATSEPFIYENNIEEWGKPVDYLLISDSGYANYAVTPIVRAEDVEAEADCLELLVPTIQESYVRFITNPEPTIDAIGRFAEAVQAPVPQTPELIRFAVDTMLAEGIVGNGGDGTYGDFEMERVQNLIEESIAAFEEQGSDQYNPDLTAEGLVTNQFVDSDISLETP